MMWKVQDYKLIASMLCNNLLIWKRKIVFSRKFKILNFNPCILEKINNHLKYIGYHMSSFLNRTVWTAIVSAFLAACRSEAEIPPSGSARSKDPAHRGRGEGSNQCHFLGPFFSGVETLSVCTGEQTGFYPLNWFPGLDKPQIAPIIVHRQSSN